MKEQTSEPSTKQHHKGYKGFKKYSQLTVEKLKCYPGLDALSDADAAKAIDAITRLSILLFHLAGKRDAHCDKFSATDSGK